MILGDFTIFLDKIYYKEIRLNSVIKIVNMYNKLELLNNLLSSNS